MMDQAQQLAPHLKLELKSRRQNVSWRSKQLAILVFKLIDHL